MKKVAMAILMAFTITSNAYSQTCTDQYREDIRKFQNSTLVKMNEHAHNGVHYISTYALNAIFGLHVLPAFLAYPIYLRILKAHQDKLWFYTDLLSDNEFSSDDKKEALDELMKMLRDRGVNVEQEEVLSEIEYLNESGALCDGSVFNRVSRGGPRHRRRVIKIKVPSKEKLVKHLSKVLK